MNIYTGGTFDTPHLGHVNFLSKCKQLAGDGKVTVSLNTDDFVEKYKGKPPLFSYENRYKLLSLLEYVDEIIPNIGGADSKPAIMLTMPDLIVIGDDWLIKDYYKQMNLTPQWLQDQEIGLCYIPYTKGISTSKIKQCVNQSL